MTSKISPQKSILGDMPRMILAPLHLVTRSRILGLINEDHQITLKGDNPAFVDIVVAPDDIQIWGVVTYAIHKDTAPTRKLPRRVK